MKKNKMIFIILSIILIIVVILGVILLKTMKSNGKKKEFLNNLKDLSYVELTYGVEEKKLDNTIAKLIKESSIAEHQSNTSNTATAVAPYNFALYDEKGECLYRILYTEVWKKGCEVNMFRELNSTVEDYDINDKDVIQYLEKEIENFNN